METILDRIMQDDVLAGVAVLVAEKSLFCRVVRKN